MTTMPPETAVDVMIRDLVGPYPSRMDGLLAVADVLEVAGPNGSVESAEDHLLEAIAAVRRWCRVCGCTDEFACAEGCTWLERDLCSSCISPWPPAPVPASTWT
jgi:hypothetical protein